MSERTNRALSRAKGIRTHQLGKTKENIMPAKKYLQTNLKEQTPEGVSPDAIRRMRERRMLEIRVFVSAGAGGGGPPPLCFRNTLFEQARLSLFPHSTTPGHD